MILVTGAQGLIGSALCSVLINNRHKVLPLYHSNNIRAISCDLAKHKHTAELDYMFGVPDTVVHLAGRISNDFDDDQAHFAELYRDNVLATANVLEYCLRVGVKHLIFASSQTVYGMPAGNPLIEDSDCHPIGHYACSKICCESLLWFGAKQGINITVLRIPGIFHENRQSGSVYNFCKQAVETKRITVGADKPIPFDIIYLDDVVNAVNNVVRCGGNNYQCLNIGTGEPCSLNMLANRIAALVPGCCVEHYGVDQPIVLLDTHRAETVLGWKPVPLYERLQQMLGSISYAS